MDELSRRSARVERGGCEEEEEEEEEATALEEEEEVGLRVGFARPA